MKKCLYCYQGLKDNEHDFHPRCANKIFGSKIAPILPYSKTEITKLAEQAIRSQSAISGVQAKLSLELKSEPNELQRFTIVGLWGHYILKPQAELFAQLPEVEDLIMHLAELSKISVVPHSLIRFADGELAYITKRIDRRENGDKLPMEDMCQLSERLTEYKYKGSYEQIAKLILKYSAIPRLDLVNYWEQVVFSWLTGNADMHLKNFSLYSTRPNHYSLTPGYDMVSTALVMPEDNEELALTLHGKKRKLKRSDFEFAMKSCGITEKVVCNIFSKFSKTASSWFPFIEQSFLAEESKVQLKSIIEEKLYSIC